MKKWRKRQLSCRVHWLWSGSDADVFAMMIEILFLLVSLGFGVRGFGFTVSF